MFLLRQIAHVGRQRALDLELFGREIIFEVFQRLLIMIPKRQRQTDRQTDMHRAVKIGRKFRRACTEHLIDLYKQPHPTCMQEARWFGRQFPPENLTRSLIYKPVCKSYANLICIMPFHWS